MGSNNKSLEEVINESYDEIDDILRGISYKYGNKFGIDPDDLCQELWYKATETIIACDNKVVLPLIVKNAYNMAVDQYRKIRRRTETQIHVVTEDGSDVEWSTEDNVSPMGSSCPFRKTEATVGFYDLLKRFKMHTRERNLFLLKAYSVDVITAEELKEFSGGDMIISSGSLMKELIEKDSTYHELDQACGSRSALFGCTQEYHYAWALGLSDSGSSSYREAKARMRKIVKDYYEPEERKIPDQSSKGKPRLKVKRNHNHSLIDKAIHNYYEDRKDEKTKERELEESLQDYRLWKLLTENLN